MAEVTVVRSPSNNVKVIPAKTTAYTIVDGDQGTLIQLSGTFSVTIPTDTTYNFPIGTTVDFLNIGTGQVTIESEDSMVSNVYGNPGTTLSNQWSAATIIKNDDNSWVLIGDLS